jgi:ferritin-like metal-binding protein YciE
MQAIELLERQIGRLENYPEMSARMRQHIAESQEQARRALSRVVWKFGLATSPRR